MTRILPDEVFICLEYYRFFGHFPDLKNPKTFNEKLQWLKLYDRKPEYTQMVDKYEAKRYVAERIGEEYIIPTYGVWNTFDEIDFDSLPNQFVLKCTHDCGGLVICKDKSQLNLQATRKKLEKCLKRNYYWQDREWPYKNVKPRIIAEKYLEDAHDDALTDYKFFCFDGVPKVMYISKDHGKEPRTDFFDMNFNHLPFRFRDPNADVIPAQPSCFSEMQKCAEKLAQGCPYLRVDFYEVDGKAYLGELTFFHMSGIAPIFPSEWDNILGGWLALPENEKTVSK